MASSLRSGKKREPETDSDTEDEGNLLDFELNNELLNYCTFLTISSFIALFP